MLTLLMNYIPIVQKLCRIGAVFNTEIILWTIKVRNINTQLHLLVIFVRNLHFKNEIFKSQSKFQLQIVNLITVSFGMSEGLQKFSSLNIYFTHFFLYFSVKTFNAGDLGWPSPNLNALTSKHSPLPSGKITMEQASWVASLLSVGCILGNTVFGYITNKFGRKWPIMLISIPTIVSKFNLAPGQKSKKCVFDSGLHTVVQEIYKLLLIMVYFQCSWMIILLAQDVYYLYVARFLIGFFQGGSYTIGNI